MKVNRLPILLLASSIVTFASYGAVLAAEMPTELTDALAGKYKGTKVTAFGAFADADEVKFNENVAAFEAQTGIDIQYESSKQFEATISTRVDAGNVPDIVDFPQPGLMGSIARTGKLIDLTTFMSEDYLKGQYIQSWLDMATQPAAGGKPTMVGVWERVNVKSLVWYPKKAFDAAGYKVPATWDELKALQDQIVADGDTPWCIGIESGAATGWAATDWMEEMMLRTTSTENYDKWTTGQLKFSSPEVTHAAEMIASIWLDPKYVYGGAKGIVSTSFGDAPAPMFSRSAEVLASQAGQLHNQLLSEGPRAEAGSRLLVLLSSWNRPASMASQPWSLVTSGRCSMIGLKSARSWSGSPAATT